MGAQVKKTVTNRKNFLPQISLRAPMRGADRKERSPLIPMMRPFMRKVWSGKVWLSTVIMGEVRRPQAKNSRKITIKAWYIDASPKPELVTTPSIFLDLV